MSHERTFPANDPHAPAAGVPARVGWPPIPILAIWSPGVPGIAANFQYNDNTAIEGIAKQTAAELKKEGKPCAVGIIQGIPVVNILNARNVGMAKGAKESGCTILEQQVNQ